MDSDEVLEDGAQLFLANRRVSSKNYNTIMFALIEKIAHLEEEIVQLRKDNG